MTIRGSPSAGVDAGERQAVGELVLSIIITITGKRQLLARCLQSLIPQIKGKPIEVIVPFDSTVEADLLPLEDPQIIFLDMGDVQLSERPGSEAAAHELYDRRKAAGLNKARGQILALLDDSCVPDPDWCEQVLEAHCLPYGVIGGVVEQENPNPLNWAIYYQDFGRYQLPMKEGGVRSLTDVNVSYKRSVLYLNKELWTERYNEAVVHWGLIKKGITLWMRPQMIVRQDRGSLHPIQTARERFAWGRLFGSLRAREISAAGRVAYILLSPGIPFLLIGRIGLKHIRGKSSRGQFLRTLPQILAMTLIWSIGEFVGSITAR